MGADLEYVRGGGLISFIPFLEWLECLVGVVLVGACNVLPKMAFMRMES